MLKKEYHTTDELDESLFKIGRYLESDLIRKHFNYNILGEMRESLGNTKGAYKNKAKVSLIKSGLRYLKNEIKQMSKNEIESERPDTIIDLAEKILDLPRNIMPELESDKSAAQRRNQRGQGLKIITPEHMLSRLPISLKSRK